MPNRLKTRASPPRAKPPLHSERPDRLRKSRTTSAANARATLLALLGELSDAISLITVVHRSLATQETGGAGDEAVALRHVLDLLRATYNGFDMAAPPASTTALVHHINQSSTRT
jgi:hypothetical protein